MDRLQDRKYIILISSGRDTFSKLNFDHVLGSYRKIKVELADGDGHPLKIRDQKGKDVKYVVVARDGYKAKQEAE